MFDLTETYFLIAGIAGVNPHEVSTGSVTLARFEVQVAQQYQIDIRDLGLNFSTGYIPYKTKLPAPAEFPQGIYGTEVFEVNDDLRNLVSRSFDAKLLFFLQKTCSQHFYLKRHLISHPKQASTTLLKPKTTG